MPKAYPPLTPREVIAILRARNFVLDHTHGGHEYYRGVIRDRTCLVTVSTHYRQLSVRLIKRMITQSGMTREEFYGSTRRTAQKLNLRSDQYPIPLKE